MSKKKPKKEATNYYSNLNLVADQKVLEQVSNEKARQKLKLWKRDAGASYTKMSGSTTGSCLTSCLSCSSGFRFSRTSPRCSSYLGSVGTSFH